jgi:hypothetical protein
MTSAMNALAAAEHVAELGRFAERRRATLSSSGDADTPTIELRVVHAKADAVRRLAALDDAPELAGRVLVALMDGEIIAGLSLHDRRVVANPFIPTREAVALLRLRAEQLSATRARRRLGRILRPRLA